MGRLRDKVTKKGSSTSRPEAPEITSSRIARAGALQTAIVSGIVGLIVAGASVAGTVNLAERTAETATTQQHVQQQYEQMEERESLNCGDAYLRVNSKAAQDPQGVATLFKIDEEESLFSAEEREVCPAYRQVLGEIQPTP